MWRVCSNVRAHMTQCRWLWIARVLFLQQQMTELFSFLLHTHTTIAFSLRSGECYELDHSCSGQLEVLINTHIRGWEKWEAVTAVHVLLVLYSIFNCCNLQLPCLMVNRDHWIVVLQKLQVKTCLVSVAVLKLWQSDFQRLKIIYDHEVFLLCHLWHEALGFKV
jgi:hypothetical protein